MADSTSSSTNETNHDNDDSQPSEAIKEEEEEEEEEEENYEYEYETTIKDASNKKEGVWVGIDLGTSNCACAVWDSNRGRAKLLRLGDIAVPKVGSAVKSGRIVPSAVLFTQKEEEEEEETVESIVGHAAMKLLEASLLEEEEEEENAEKMEDISAAMVTSVKRILGLTKQQTQILFSEGKDDDGDDDFLQSLPFQTVSTSSSSSSTKHDKNSPFSKTNSQSNRVDVENKDKQQKHSAMNPRKQIKNTNNNEEEEEEGLLVQIAPLQNKHQKINSTTTTTTTTISPVQVASILLHSIKIAAQDYLSKPSTNISAPGMMTTMPFHKNNKKKDKVKIENCVIGVPAHFGTVQRKAVTRAAKLAGFDGHVSTVTESTAAAMAYGLHVSTPPPPPPPPTMTTNNNDNKDDSSKSQKDEEKEKRTSSSTFSSSSHNKKNNASSNSSNNNNNNKSVRSILVFDMGGGTTDVTIAEMSMTSSSEEKERHQQSSSSSSSRFQVIATAGDRHLGGDDMDEALVKFVLHKTQQQPKNEKEDNDDDNNDDTTTLLSPGKKRRLHQQCKKAKELLCGTKDDPPKQVTTIQMHNNVGTTTTTKEKKTAVEITKDDFEKVISHLVVRAQHVVEEALDAYSLHLSKRDDDDDDEEEEKGETSKKKAGATTTTIDEVVLVGGATRVPAVQQMLRDKFPPPIPPDLCCSVNAEAAVAQGCAIRAAVLSGLVPRYELRSALMLDALPHSIGVLVPNIARKKEGENEEVDNDDGGGGGGGGGGGEDDELYIPILNKDAPLPAMDHATFTLADVNQRGVTVVAVEDVGDEFPLQRLGEFTFLLHKLTEEEKLKKLDGRGVVRKVDIGMTVDTSGRFIVSIYDSNDPEHVEKKRRYQEERKRKRKRKGIDANTTIAQEEKYKKEKKDDDVIFQTEHKNFKDEEEEEDDDEETSMPMEQVYLTVMCIMMFLIYVAARIAFSEPPAEESARII